MHICRFKGIPPIRNPLETGTSPSLAIKTSKITYVRSRPLICKRASFYNAGARTYIQLKITGAMNIQLKITGAMKE
jgi:hypothetical protein